MGSLSTINTMCVCVRLERENRTDRESDVHVCVCVALTQGKRQLRAERHIKRRDGEDYQWGVTSWLRSALKSGKHRNNEMCIM